MAGYDQTINYHVLHNHYEEEGLNLLEANQNIAISVVGDYDGLTKYDPKYVRMIAKYFYLDEQGNNIYENIPVNTCTDNDWAKFHTPDTVT